MAISGVPPAGRRQILRFIAEEDYATARVDSALAELTGETRSCVRRWIDSECVRINGRLCRPSQRLQVGDEVEATPPEITTSELLPEPIPLSILFEDPDLIVIDKPPGMVVHPGPGHDSGTLVNALLYHCRDLAGIGGVERPGIVHRLDRGTSGVMVAAKNDRSHLALAEQFHDHSIDRVYWALVRGCPGDREGCVDRPIGRHPRDRKRMSVHTHSGRPACTRWRVLRRFVRQAVSWLEIHPETGRTHQIRVHLACAGLPLVGDPVYGRGKRRGRGLLERPGLHAALLGFDHPTSGKRLRFRVGVPGDLRAALCQLGRGERG